MINVMDTSTDGGRVPEPVSPLLHDETCIVFDWDDTILPTSWIERCNGFQGGPLRPEVSRQLAHLCVVAAQTINMAACMGTVIIITNSVPGWLDQSGQVFMPQIMQQMRQYPWIAKPMNQPITFKIGAFRRECSKYKNIISIGDGESERSAILRMQAPSNMGAFATMGDGDRNDPAFNLRCIKSVKLLDGPSCQQLVQQHEMLQAKLADVVGFQGFLDLKSKLSTGGKNAMCSLMHLGRPQGPGVSNLRPGAAPFSAETFSPGRSALAALGPSRLSPQGTLPALGRLHGRHPTTVAPYVGTEFTGCEASTSAALITATHEGRLSEPSAVGAAKVGDENKGSDVGQDSTKPDFILAAVGRPTTPSSSIVRGKTWQGATSVAAGKQTIFRNTRPMAATGLSTKHHTGAAWRENSAPAAVRGLQSVAF